MSYFKVVLIGIFALAVVACSPSNTDDAKFLGSWHTAPMTEKVTKQSFADISHKSGDAYSVTTYWQAPGSTSAKKTTDLKMKDGVLIGPLNSVLKINADGNLNFEGQDYSR